MHGKIGHALFRLLYWRIEWPPMSSKFDFHHASDMMERDLAHPLVEDAFPYRAYSAVHDARTSKHHLALESLGIDGSAIYHADDPAWRVFRPPWGARHCRCTWYPVSVEQAAVKGIIEAHQWMERARDMAL